MYSVVVIFQQVNLLCYQPVTRELLVYYRSYTSMITKPSSLNEGDTLACMLLWYSIAAGG